MRDVRHHVTKPFNHQGVIMSEFSYEVVNTVRVLYNPYNIDSCLAVCIAAERLHKDNPETSIQVVAADSSNHDTFKSSVDLLIICGAVMTVKDFIHEVDMCEPKVILNFRYLGDKNAELIMAPPDTAYHLITPITNSDPSTDEDVEQIYSENSLSFMVNALLQKTGYGDKSDDDQKRLMTVVSNYINFRRFDSIYTKDDDSNKIVKRTNDDLTYLHQHMDGIRESSALGLAYDVKSQASAIVKNYMTPITMVRKIIQRNMMEKTYVDKTKYMKLQTVCVGEENAIEVMRQLSYALPSVVTYEDVQDYRVWRILASGVHVIEMLRSILQPVHEWTDCRIQYFACDLPKISEKISN